MLKHLSLYFPTFAQIGGVNEIQFYILESLVHKSIRSRKPLYTCSKVDCVRLPHHSCIVIINKILYELHIIECYLRDQDQPIKEHMYG